MRAVTESRGGDGFDLARHAADADVIVGGLVVRQSVLQRQEENPLCQQISGSRVLK